MFKKMLLLVTGVLLSVSGSVLATDVWWHGGVSANVNDPANWTDRNAATAPTTPTGDPYDIVRIGASWDSEDLNNNGVLDPGEDLNGNGVIDDPDPNSGVGYGGWYGGGGGVVLAVNPVLDTTYVSRTGTARGGWWFVLNTPNILTLKNGAFLIMSRQDCNLRNGGRLEVQGRSATDGPSLVIPRRFRIAENGAIVEAAAETSQLRINGTGWVQMDPQLSGGGVGFYIGQTIASLPVGPRGEIVIENKGRLELMTADPQLYIDFGSTDPARNQIIIRDEGELWLSGDMATIGRVGDADTTTSLQDLIAMRLIATSNASDTLTFSGTNPTIVKLAARRVGDPKPSDGAVNVDRHVVLSWFAGTMTNKYDVYVGTNAADVNNATRANPLGVLKSQGQTQAYYPTDGTWTLQYGQTYYWRVDEVDVPPNQEILKGKVWSFTVEPFAIRMPAASITATASGSATGQGPENTINGSGLDANDFHSTVTTDMWFSDATTPTWIEYTFDQTYKIRQMLVWNYNASDFLTGFGLKEVTIEYSADGTTWAALAGVPAFEQAAGEAGYAANTTVNFGDVGAKKVRITVKSNWGNSPLFSRYGLSEVRFMYVPVAARFPSPASGAKDVAVDTTLSWIAGREAVEHKVYLGTDQQAVAGGTAVSTTIQQTSYSPSLNLGTTYYWRVDEVNAAQVPSTWAGSVWNFATTSFLVVDDMESYNDTTSPIYGTWVDGYGTTTNGCQVGNDQAPFVNKTTVHGGTQSMPFRYNISGAYTLSEATQTFAIAQDWSVHGIKTLTVFFYGNTANTAAGLYVKINGTKISFAGDAAGVSKAEWTQWDIPLSSVPASTLQSVTSLTLGAATGTGNLLFDDIGLYR